MAQDPFISIITPFHNVRAYLAEAIESVLCQSYRDWELILVDDGSDDGSRDIALHYRDRHPGRISVLEHPGHANRGISASRNLGAAAARGAWLACLDGDDVWLPEKLAQQVEIVRAHPEIGLVLGASLYWYSWSGADGDRDRLIAVGAPQDTVIAPPGLLTMLYPLHRGAAPSMNTVLVRASIVRQVGGWEEQFPNAYEDQALLAKLYLETPAYVASACCDRYRQRPDSCMAIELSARGYHRHRRRFLEWFETYLLERGLVGTACWTDLQRALRRYRHPLWDRLARLTRRAIEGAGTIRPGR